MNRLTFDMLLDKFLYRHLRIDTIKSYEKAVRQLQHNCNLKYPDEVSKLLILQWRKAVVGKSIIEVTWNSYVRQLKPSSNLALKTSFFRSQKSF